MRPLISLLHHDRSGLQNFEALLALTNLSSVSENIRYIFKGDQRVGAHALVILVASYRCVFTISLNVYF